MQGQKLQPTASVSQHVMRNFWLGGNKTRAKKENHQKHLYKKMKRIG
jgi:hypothetical protein